MSKAYLIMADSGGIQEEAPSLHKPVLVLRDATERPEAIEAGAAKLIGTDADRIYSETLRLIDEPESYCHMSNAINPFGDGHAGRRIVQFLLGQPIEKVIDRSQRGSSTQWSEFRHQNQDTAKKYLQAKTAVIRRCSSPT